MLVGHLLPIGQISHVILPAVEYVPFRQGVGEDLSEQLRVKYIIYPKVIFGISQIRPKTYMHYT